MVFCRRTKLRKFGVKKFGIVFILISIIFISASNYQHSPTQNPIKYVEYETESFPKPFSIDIEKFEDVTLTLSQGKTRDSCRLGKPELYRGNYKCLRKLKKTGSFCNWHEEIADWFGEYTKPYSWFKNLSKPPCKSTPPLKVNEFPKPICTRTSVLFFTDTELCTTRGSWVWRERSSELSQLLWYQQVGTWEIFRQSYRAEKDKNSSFSLDLCLHIPENLRMLEFGSGVAPISNFILRHCKVNIIDSFSITDASAEHLFFGAWRLRWKLDALGKHSTSLYVNDYDGKYVNFNTTFNFVTLTAVYEHLSDGLGLTKHFFRYLSPGAIVVEQYPGDYIPDAERASITSDNSYPDVGMGKINRKSIHEYYKNNCVLFHTTDLSGHGHYPIFHEKTARWWRCLSNARN